MLLAPRHNVCVPVEDTAKIVALLAPSEGSTGCVAMKVVAMLNTNLTVFCSTGTVLPWYRSCVPLEVL